MGKLAITLLHGGVLLLSIIPARLLVAESLGLPPQDFDVTVTFCVLLFYLPVWLIVFQVLTLLFAFIRFIVSGLCSLTTYFPISVLVLLIAKPFPEGSRPRLFLEQNIENFVLFGVASCNRRLRLHENGVISYAEERGWDIIISVDKIQ
jgi:hypothetical protein